MNVKWLISLLPLLLGACIGINPNASPNDSFTVPVAYEIIFERAKAQAQRTQEHAGHVNNTAKGRNSLYYVFLFADY